MENTQSKPTESSEANTVALPKPITVDSSLIRAAQLCQSTNHVRHCLNGISLTTDGQVQATNGHLMFVSDAGFQLTEGQTISIEGRLPRKGNAQIEWLSEDAGFITVSRPGGSHDDKHFYFTVVKGKWPDLSKVIPSNSPVANTGIQIASQYLKVAAKAFCRYSAITITNFSEDMSKPVMFAPKNPVHSHMASDSNPRIYVMQMKDR